LHWSLQEVVSVIEVLLFVRLVIILFFIGFDALVFSPYFRLCHDVNWDFSMNIPTGQKNVLYRFLLLLHLPVLLSIAGNAFAYV
jgi:hypothetical protein